MTKANARNWKENGSVNFWLLKGPKTESKKKAGAIASYGDASVHAGTWLKCLQISLLAAMLGAADT